MIRLKPLRHDGPALRRLAMAAAMLASGATGATVTSAMMDTLSLPAAARPGLVAAAPMPREAAASALAPTPITEPQTTGAITLAQPGEGAPAKRFAARSPETVPAVSPPWSTPSSALEATPIKATPSKAMPSTDLLASREPPIRSWSYQLQGVDPAQIARSGGDVVVIDYAGEKGPFSPAEIERMREKPDGSHRRVLAYLSIGEAEDYRFYWRGDWRSAPPPWLGAESRQWRHNYAVRFWEPAWQAIILDYADRIVAAGFDGVYLDRVDAFEQQGHAPAMVDFVARIAARAKARRADFMVVSQNGDALITDRKFRDAIDAFAREDLIYGAHRDGSRNPPEDIRESVDRLKLIAAQGKPVLVVEYPRDEQQAQAARQAIAQAGFVGLMVRRALDRL
jgi:cysteinyl-tRNA synthetase